MMQAEFAYATHPTGVAQGELRQSDVRSFADGRVLSLASALGPPRLWGYGLDAVFAGIAEGLERPHDGRLITQLHQAFEGARQRLRSQVDALVERHRCDVGLALLALDASSLHVLCAGPVRAYLRRLDTVRRLTPNDDRSEGLLKVPASAHTERVEPGDLVVAGSLTAFCDESLQRLGTALAHDHLLPPHTVIELLNASAAGSRRGVSSLALRVAIS